MSAHASARHSYRNVLAEMWQNKVFCDAVLQVEKDEFPVHKVILCDASSYFRAMFERWDFRHRREFPIAGVSPRILSLVLDFIYTGSAAPTRRNVQALVLAADLFLLKDLVKSCFDFMERHLCPENCVGVWKFSDVVVSPSTRRAAWRYVLSNFEEVAAGKEFLELTAQELARVIETDDLNVKHESAVFEAVVLWVNHALDERQREFPQLFAKVRVSLMPLDYIGTKVMPNALVEADYECMSSVLDSMQAAQELAVSRTYPLDRPRLPSAILLAIGGWSGGDPTNGIEAYDHKTNLWVDVTLSQERPRAYHGSVFLRGSVYCVGGFDRSEYFNTMRRLDLSAHTWHEMPPMYHRRCYVSATVMRDCIYAVGGYNGQIRLKSAEVFDPETNQWSLIASMSEQRSDASCAALNDKIYICGGFNGNECLQTAECYNPDTNQWTNIAPMTTSRSGIGVIAYANQIYAVGGFDGHSRLRSVETYNPRSNRWQEVTPMLTARSNFGIEVLDDRIFAVGGFNGLTTTFCVEAYDRLLGAWTEVSEMGIFRSAVDCCVISGLSNMADYTESWEALLLRDAEDEEEQEEEEGEEGEDEVN